MKNVLGHFNFFSEDLRRLIDKELRQKSKNLDNLSYFELYSFLKIISDKESLNNKDKDKVVYLLAKLAAIHLDISFFKDHQNYQTNIGYQIWYISILIAKKKNEKAMRLLKEIKEKIQKSDTLIYLDYLLVSMSFNYQTNKPDQVIQGYEQFLGLNEIQEKYLFSKLGIILNSALAHYILGKKDKFNDLINEGIELSRKHNEQYHNVKFLNILSFLKLSENKLLEAKELQIKALKLCKSSGNKVEEAKLLRTMGMQEFQLGDYDKALKYQYKAKKINLEIKNLSELSICYFACANTLLHLGNYEESKKYYLKGLEIFEKSGDIRNQIRTRNGLGILYQDEGNLSKALECYSSSLKLAKKHNYVIEVLDLLNNIGTLHKEKGDYIIALAYFEDGLKTYISTEPIYNASKLFLNLADLYLNEGKFKKAIDMVESALKLKSVNKEDRGYLFYIKSTLFFELGEFPQAEETSKKAIEFFEKTNSPYNTALALKQQGRIAHIVEDEKQAIDLLIKSLVQLENIKSFGDLYLSINLELAEIYLLNNRMEEFKLKIEEIKRRIVKSGNDNETCQLKIKFLELNYKFNQESELQEKDFLLLIDQFESKNFFILSIKTKLLLISYYIKKLQIKRSINLLDDIKKIALEKNIITLEIETNFLKSLLLNYQELFKSAKEELDQTKKIIRQYSLKYFEQKRAEIEDIINKNISFSSIYKITENERKESLEKKLKKEDDEKEIAIVKEYLAFTMKKIRENKIIV